MDIGKSAVNAQRQALNVTGQNIANVNTEGYRRRDAGLLEVSGSQSELASKTAQIGLGVTLGEVRRSFNQYLAKSSNSAESKFEAATTFVGSMERLENLVLPSEGDLSSQITEFFSKLSDVAANPGDLAPRAAALEQASGMASSFKVTAEVVGDLKKQIQETMTEEVEKLNRLLEAIAEVNGRLRASNIGGAPPNALLDERDRLVTEVSKKIRVSIKYGERSEADISLGRFDGGPVIVAGANAKTINITHNDVSGSIFTIGSGQAFKTLDDGSLRGLSDSLAIIESTGEKLDFLALRVVSELNSIHTMGIDYDGEKGKELFTAREFSVSQPATNSKRLNISLLQVPGKVDSLGEMYASFDAGTDFWTVKDASGNVIGKGRSEIDLGGLILKVESKAMEGDNFNLNRVRGEAGRIEFLLQDGKEIAAAANFVVTPASRNTGSAVVTSSTASLAAPNINNILDITTNSISPVSYTEFSRGGAVGFIPQNLESLNLASFGQSPLVEYSFGRTEGLGGFSLTMNSVKYDFPSVETTSVLSPQTDSGVNIILPSDSIARLLNDGVIKSTSGQTFNDLGLHASAYEGGLKVAGPQNFSAATMTNQKGSASTPTIRDAVSASKFSVFTREGRQVAGQPLSASDAARLLSAENGFVDNASYRADYLNTLNGEGYRGAEISNVLPDGYGSIGNLANVLTNASVSQLVNKSPALNQIASQTLIVNTSDGLVNETIFLDASLSMKDVAKKLNDNLAEAGISAKSTTLVSLELDSSADANGSLSISLKADGGTKVTVSTDYSDGNLKPLSDNINLHTSRTGVTAQLTRDNSRIVLISDEGSDIIINKVSGQQLTVNALDQSYNKILTSDVVLSSETKVIGTVELNAPRAFSISSSLGQTQSSQTNDAINGGLSKQFSDGGSSTFFSVEVPEDLLFSQSSPSGTRLAAATTEFDITGVVNNGTTAIKLAEIKAHELTGFSSKEISEQLIKKARLSGMVASIEGNVISNLPHDNSVMSIKVGGSEYTITYSGGSLLVDGPEDDRILASLETVTGGYRVSLAAPDGLMSGRSIEVLDNTQAAAFGLAKTDAGSFLKLQGRNFTFDKTTPITSAALASGMANFVASIGTNVGVNDNEITLAAAGTADGTVNIVIDGVTYTTGTVDVSSFSSVANQADRIAALLNANSNFAAKYVATSDGTSKISVETLIKSAEVKLGNTCVNVQVARSDSAVTGVSRASGLTNFAASTASGSSDHIITIDTAGTANGTASVIVGGTTFTTGNIDQSMYSTKVAQAGRITELLNGNNNFSALYKARSAVEPVTVTSSSIGSGMSGFAASVGSGDSNHIISINSAGSTSGTVNFLIGGVSYITETLHQSNYITVAEQSDRLAQLLNANTAFSAKYKATSDGVSKISITDAAKISIEAKYRISSTTSVTRSDNKSTVTSAGIASGMNNFASSIGSSNGIDDNEITLSSAGTVDGTVKVKLNGTTYTTGAIDVTSAVSTAASASGMANFSTSIGTNAGINDHEITVSAAGTADGTVRVVIGGVTYTTGTVDVSTDNTIAKQTDRIATLLNANAGFAEKYIATSDGTSKVMVTTSLTSQADRIAALLNADNNFASKYDAVATKAVTSAALASGMTNFLTSIGTNVGVNDNEITLTAAGTADGTVNIVIDGVTYTTGTVDVSSFSTVANQTDRIAALLNANSSFTAKYVATSDGISKISIGTKTISVKTADVMTNFVSNVGSIGGINDHQIIVTAAGTADGKVGFEIDGLNYTTASVDVSTYSSIAQQTDRISALLNADSNFSAKYVATSDGVSKISVTSSQLLFGSPVAGQSASSSISIDPTVNNALISLVTPHTSGQISLTSSAHAKELGMQAGDFDFELSSSGFKAISSSSSAAQVNLDISGISGQLLKMKNLPAEELIVVFDNAGAKRLAAQYTEGDTSALAAEERTYRMRMTDKDLGKVELIDVNTGHSIATRFTSGVTDFDIDGYNLVLSGFADDDDFFDISLNTSNSGDARNVEAMIDLGRASGDGPSFQDDFRAIALAVGSQLISGRLVEKSATAMRDAALVTEDELSGVNLDEEASRLMEQQQAYKAAAQILQTAREMFDTLVRIM